MTDDTVHLITREDFDRIGRAVRFVEQFAREQLNVTPNAPGFRGTRGDETAAWPVKCTGSALTSPAELDGLHPGIAYLPDPSVDPPWREEIVWLIPLPDQELEIGERGMGRRVGWRDVFDMAYPAAPIYALVGGGADYEDRCENGFLQRYKAVGGGEYQWDYDLGVPCPMEPYTSAASHDYPVILDVVTKVCKPCADGIGDVVIKPTTTSLGTCWLPADGSTANRTTYADLFAVYGTTHGAGDGTTTFGLPDIDDPVAGLSYFVRAASTDLTVERRRVSVFAGGQVSPPECEVNPDGCCPEELDEGDYGVGGEACCPDLDLVAEIGAVASGPIGETGSTCEVVWDLIRDTEDGLSWIGISAAGEEACEGVSIAARVWCLKDEDGIGRWYIAGAWIDFAGDAHNFGPLEMEDVGDGFLSALVDVPGQEETLEIVVERPCTGLPPEPGASCAEAGTLSLGVPITSDITGFPDHWWKFTAPSAGTYSVILTAITGEGSVTSSVYTGNCDTLVFVDDLLGEGCISVTLSEGGTAIFDLGADGDANYTIEVSAGACP